MSDEEVTNVVEGRALPYLYELIHSLTPNEKKYFRSRPHPKIISDIFSILDKQNTFSDSKAYDELAAILKKKEIELTQDVWRVRKQQTYAAILTIMRSYQIAEVQINKEIKSEILDVRFLYEKGLYEPCSKLLYKLRTVAKQHERYIDLIEITRMEILLHNAQSKDVNVVPKLKKLEVRLREYNKILTNYFEYLLTYSSLQNNASPLSLGGQIKPEMKAEYIKNINDPIYYNIDSAKSFEAKVLQHLLHSYYLESIEINSPGIFQRLYSKTRTFLDFMEKHSKLLASVPTLHLAVLANQLRYARQINPEAASAVFESVKKLKFKSDKLLSEQKFLQYWYECSASYISGDFGKIHQTLPAIEKFISQYGHTLGLANILRLSFVIARLHVSEKKYDKAKEWLLKITSNFNPSHPRHDIHAASRILLCLVYSETGNNELRKEALNTINFMKRLERLNSDDERRFLSPPNMLLLKYFQSISKTKNNPETIRVLINGLNSFNNPADTMLLRYFDYSTWFGAKLKNSSFAMEMKEKFDLNNRQFSPF